MYYLSVESMATLNKNAAALMKKHECHGATDITGFGLKGHAENLVAVQKNDVDFQLNALPVFAGTPHVNNEIFNFKLLDGFSAETSGGLMILIPEANSQAYMEELRQKYGQQSWKIGQVNEGSRKVIFETSSMEVIEVSEPLVAAEAEDN